MKLVTQYGTTEVILGAGDPTAEGDTSFEKAIDSWKKAEEKLNNAARLSTGISTARSIAIEDIEKLASIPINSDYGKVGTYSSGTFVDEDGNTVIATQEKPITVKSTYRYTPRNSKLTTEQIGSLNNKISYFLANLNVFVNGSYARYYCQTMYDGGITGWMLFIANSGSYDSCTAKIRAIVYI